MRCYEEAWATGEGACPNQARYRAKLDWTEGPMALCEEHAILEREWGAVIEIYSLDRRP